MSSNLLSLWKQKCVAAGAKKKRIVYTFSHIKQFFSSFQSQTWPPTADGAKDEGDKEHWFHILVPQKVE